MARYNTRGRTQAFKPAPTSYLTSEQTASGTTANGAPGFARDSKSELFFLAIANFVTRDEFHEDAFARDNRFKALVRRVAVEDTEWMARFVPWLRLKANMRTASMIAAAETVWALNQAGVKTGREIVDSALQRADEPGEAVAYWTTNYGRNMPAAFERGVADAVKRLYTEYTLLKYDTRRKGVRFGAVLKATHPRLNRYQAAKAIFTPGVDLDAVVADYEMWPQLDDWLRDKRALFQYACDRVDGTESLQQIVGTGDEAALPMIYENIVVRSRAAEVPEVLLNPEAVRNAGLTWEDVLSLAGDKLPKAKLWEAVIPTMGYDALLKNLRNFDQAGVSDAVARRVCVRLTEPEQVANSRLFPYRFLAAYQNTSSLRWAQALETALNLSLSNVPPLPGTTLVLVDRSWSMFPDYSGVNKDGVSRADHAAIFGTSLVLRNYGRAQLVQYGSGSEEVHLQAGEAVLKAVTSKFKGFGGTDTAGAVRRWYNGHNRVVIITDEQANMHQYSGVASAVPDTVPVYTWNLAGYERGHEAIQGLRYAFGGLTDQAFKAIPLLEQGVSQNWPF